MLLALLLACKPPPTAPTELAELCNFLFREAGEGDEREEYLRLGLQNLDDWLQVDIDATAEGYTVDLLEQEMVDGLGISGYTIESVAALDAAGAPTPIWLDGRGPSTAALLGAAIAVRQEYPPDGIALATTWADQQEVMDGDFNVYERTWYDDKDAFMQREILRMEASSYSEADYFGLIKVNSNNWIQYRWVETPDGWALVHRSWLVQPAEVSWDGVSVNAQYLLAVTLPATWNPGGSIRMMTTWIEAKYGGLDRDYALTQINKSMAGQGAMIDEWLSEQFAIYGDVEGVMEAGG